MCLFFTILFVWAYICGVQSPQDYFSTYFTMSDVIKDGDIETVNKLIADGVLKVNKPVMFYGSYLSMAAAYKQAEIVRMFIAAEVDLNMQEKEYGLTALMLASENGQIEIVRVLLEAGANVNIQLNSRGHCETALDIAIRQGHTEIVDTLRAAGAVEGEKINSICTISNKLVNKLKKQFK